MNGARLHASFMRLSCVLRAYLAPLVAGLTCRQQPGALFLMRTQTQERLHHASHAPIAQARAQARTHAIIFGAVLDVALRVELDPLFEGAQEVAR